MFPIVPPMLLSLSKCNVEKEYDISSLRLLLVGAAPVAPELLKNVAEKLNCVIVQGDKLFHYSRNLNSFSPEASFKRWSSQKIFQKCSFLRFASQPHPKYVN